MIVKLEPPGFPDIDFRLGRSSGRRTPRAGLSAFNTHQLHQAGLFSFSSCTCTPRQQPTQQMYASNQQNTFQINMCVCVWLVDISELRPVPHCSILLTFALIYIHGDSHASISEDARAFRIASQAPEILKVYIGFFSKPKLNIFIRTLIQIH